MTLVTPGPALQFVTDEIVALHIHESCHFWSGSRAWEICQCANYSEHGKYRPLPAKMLHHRYLEHKEVQTSFFGINDRSEDH